MQAQTVKSRDKPASQTGTVFKKILVAVDGSESAKRAASVAVGLAGKLGADLTVFHAISPPTSYYGSTYGAVPGAIPPPISQKEIDSYYEYARRVASEIVSEPINQAKKLGISVKTEIPEGVSSTVETIINHANKNNADLIVVGTRGLGGFKKLVMGSVSSGVVSHADSAVLVVR